MATILCSVYTTVKAAIDAVFINLSQVGTAQISESRRETRTNYCDKFLIHFNLKGKTQSLWFDKERYCFNRIFIGKSKITFAQSCDIGGNGLPRKTAEIKLDVDTFINHYMEHIAEVSYTVEIMPTQYKTNTKKVIEALQDHGFKLHSKCKIGSYRFDI